MRFKKAILACSAFFVLSNVVASEGVAVYREDMGSPTNMLIPAGSDARKGAIGMTNGIPNAYAFKITSGNYTLPEGVISRADGKALDESQKARLQAIINNNMHDYLGLEISATPPLLPHIKSSGFSRKQYLPLPSTLPIAQEVTVTFQPVTWSGDRDTARFYFAGVNSELKAPNGGVYDSGKVNWSSTGWGGDVPLRDVEVTVQPDTSQLYFYGQCNRVSGSYCSAYIEKAYATFNSDLPRVGEVVTVQEPQ